jgi:hypothetical protein
MMDTNAQIFLDYAAATATHLTRVARVDLPYTPSSLFRFVRCVLNKLTPRRVCNRLGETMILEHSLNVQLFKDDDVEAILIIFRALSEK